MSRKNKENYRKLKGIVLDYLRRNKFLWGEPSNIYNMYHYYYDPSYMLGQFQQDNELFLEKLNDVLNDIESTVTYKQQRINLLEQTISDLKDKQQPLTESTNIEISTRSSYLVVEDNTYSLKQGGDFNEALRQLPKGRTLQLSGNKEITKLSSTKFVYKDGNFNEIIDTKD